MILCLCEGVSDRAVQQAIGQGCSTVRAIASTCGAGRQCGSCVCDLRRMLQSAPEGSDATATNDDQRSG
jgi:bacterioferritin-associated ferredoxin